MARDPIVTEIYKSRRWGDCTYSHVLFKFRCLDNRSALDTDFRDDRRVRLDLKQTYLSSGSLVHRQTWTSKLVTTCIRGKGLNGPSFRPFTVQIAEENNNPRDSVPKIMQKVLGWAVIMPHSVLCINKSQSYAGAIVPPSIPSQATMARGTGAYGLDARDRRFDSGCAARFFRYETSVMCHLQVESEGTAHFFMLKSWKVLIFFG